MASGWNLRAWTRLIRFFLLALVCVIIAFVWINVRRASRQNELQSITASPTPKAEPSNSVVGPDTTPAPIASPSVSTTPLATASPITVQPTPATDQIAAPSIGAKSLLIPVAGVRPDQLQDTYDDARSEGRVHDAIDIPAAHNTPVLAAADGRIVKLFQSERGGTTIYQLDTDNRTVYYYAHLDHYADNLSEGQMVRRGDVIAYVGDTGNAGAGNYHLHFSISIVADPKHFYNGTNINPYPLLRGAP
jgi:murein DD-endopeptidase MepM/ murein hydrolase activator NlpD